MRVVDPCSKNSNWALAKPILRAIIRHIAWLLQLQGVSLRLPREHENNEQRTQRHGNSDLDRILIFFFLYGIEIISFANTFIDHDIQDRWL